jgi:hypothetical protein
VTSSRFARSRPASARHIERSIECDHDEVMNRSLCFLAWPLLFIVRCGGSDSTAIDGGTDGTIADTSTTDSASDAPSDAPADVITDAGTGCEAGCRACCRQSHPDAGAIIRKDEMTCACNKPGDCEAGTTCGSNLCSAMKETVACIACLDDPDAGDCTQKALAKCAAQPECAAFEQCILACGDGG